MPGRPKPLRLRTDLAPPSPLPHPSRHQVAFIVKSKSLAFITSGLLSGALGFMKLYRCATKWEIHGHGSCEQKAPGMQATFWFEYTLFLVRTILVWITFMILWKFEEVQAWKKKRDA